MDITLPQEQAHGSSAPLLVPLYQTCRLTPNENIPTIQPTGLGTTRSVTFELAPDNCMNFSKFLLEYDITYKKSGSKHLCLYNTFNIAFLKVYNTAGVNLLLLDDSYNHYRDLMTLLCRKTRNIKRQKYCFDGYALHSEQQTIEGRDITITSPSTAYVEHVKIPFEELWNTLLSCKTDLFFGEKIYIQIKWGLVSGFGCHCDSVTKSTPTNPVPFCSR